MPIAFQSSPLRREIAPPGHQVWLREKEGQFASFEKEFLEWVRDLQSNEELYKQHVYQNDNPTDLDFRQHRTSLSVMIAWGETSALKFLAIEGQGAERYVELIDEKIAALRLVFHEWHAPVDADENLPQSTREGAKEALEGYDLQEMDALLGD